MSSLVRKIFATLAALSVVSCNSLPEFLGSGASDDAATNGSSTETVSEPVAVGGTYLVCAEDPTLAVNGKTAMGCALHANGRKIELAKVSSVETRVTGADGTLLPSETAPLTNNPSWHWAIQVAGEANLVNAKLQVTIAFEGKEPVRFEEVVTESILAPAAAEPIVFVVPIPGTTGDGLYLLDVQQPISLKLPTTIRKSLITSSAVIARLELKDENDVKVVCTYSGTGRDMAFESCNDATPAGSVHQVMEIELNVVDNAETAGGFTLTIVASKETLP